MKVLVIGSGAREHALAWALGRDPDFSSGRPARDRIFCAPGNAGTEAVARNLPIDPGDSAAVVAACRELDIGLVVVGPEAPLAAGLVDILAAAGIPAFGPHQKAAALEASKTFGRSFAERHGVPCASSAKFTETSSFRRFLADKRGLRIVLKKSGLAAGKGVFESDDPAELASFGEAVLESDELLAEEFLVGRELSVFALCDNSDRLLLPACADHKKAGPDDSGPNTGGMGAACPVPYADDILMTRIEREIVDPSFLGMGAEGLRYRGLLFFGIMVTAEGPRLLEYNVRFGDPEAESLLPLLDSSFLELCSRTAGGGICSLRPVFSGRVACGVVIAAPGYPGNYPTGLTVEIAGDETSRGSLAPDGGTKALLFHAATARDAVGRLRTGGGRCFSAVGLGPDWGSAHDRAYDLARAVRFEGAWVRPDIGSKIYPLRNSVDRDS